MKIISESEAPAQTLQKWNWCEIFSQIKKGKAAVLELTGNEYRSCVGSLSHQQEKGLYLTYYVAKREGFTYIVHSQRAPKEIEVR